MGTPSDPFDTNLTPPRVFGVKKCQILATRTPSADLPFPTKNPIKTKEKRE